MQRQIPGGSFVNETGGSSRQIPGGSYVNETASANVTLVAPLGSLTLSGLIPAITQGNSLTAVLGTLTLSGLVPTVTQGHSLVAVLGSLQLAGPTPTVVQPIALTAPLGAMTLSGLVPTVAQPVALTAVLGTLTLAGLTPTVVQPVGMAAPLGSLLLAGLVPTFGQSAIATTTSTGGGKPRNRRKTYLDIDGLLYEVTTREEVATLLRAVRERAKQDAVKVEAPKPVKRRKAKPAPVEVAAPVYAPQVKLYGYDTTLIDDMQPRLARFAAELRALERDLAEQDDEEVLLLLGGL